MPGIHPGFIQAGPELSNSYMCDDLLQAYLRWKLPADIMHTVEPDLQAFGGRCVSELRAWSQEAERQKPEHVPLDPWGRRIDEIRVSAAWERLHAAAAEEGLVAIGYERKHGEFSRLHQFAKLYLFHPSSAFVTCPLAMTDGAARVIELHGSLAMRKGAFHHLTSRDPKRFWTSGQWMTERTGGSDVSGTSTIARPAGAGYVLSGDKWFTSATTSQMAMALAKVEGASDAREGLSLFYVELRDEAGRLQNIRINRLKDKLGTTALPTAELTLDQTPATLVGAIGDGVKTVSSILNITRLYNSATALGTMARALYLAKDYALKRQAFGRALADQPLHLWTLARAQAEFEGVFALGFHLIHLLGKDETGQATADERAILRLLTPVMKLWSAKVSIAITSEVIESFGGAGYIEDTGIPRLLRDAQVFSIWEGTTNVLSLDVLRAVARDGSLEAFFQDFESRLSGLARLPAETARVKSALKELKSFALEASRASPDQQAAGARAFAMGLARVGAAALLLEFASWAETTRPRAMDVAQRFCARPLVELPGQPELDREQARRLLYGP